jgi:hypothetical protein
MVFLQYAMYWRVLNLTSTFSTANIIVDFKSLFKAQFQSLLQTCQIRFQFRKLGANFASKFASSFQGLNFVCKHQMFILNNNDQFNEIQTFLVA